MNPTAISSAAHIFMRATQPGPAREAAAVTNALAKLQAQGGTGRLDGDELESALDAEFPWRRQRDSRLGQLQPAEEEIWIETVRWLMDALLATDSRGEGGASRFHALIATLGALDVSFEGLRAVLGRFIGTHVMIGLAPMLESFAKEPPTTLNARHKMALQELTARVRSGDLKMLRHAPELVRPELGIDVRTAAFLLWKLDPAQLARIIDAHDSIILTTVVCEVLGEDAPVFALEVQNIMFKFASVPWLHTQASNRPEATAAAVHKRLLLQVAKTPLWKRWLIANYEHPEISPPMSKTTLAEALIELSAPQWRDFISALALSKTRDSDKGVAEILVEVSRKIGAANAQPFWSAAFERWEAWNYGKSDEQFHLSSPQICSLDYPVAMYYACLPAADRDALERKLSDDIAHIEQAWFADEGALYSERNRLASILRLVRHGCTIAAGGSEPLPPPVRPDSEYAEVRYRYLDVNERAARA